MNVTRVMVSMQEAQVCVDCPMYLHMYWWALHSSPLRITSLGWPSPPFGSLKGKLCTKPFSQPRDAAQQGEECADSSWKKMMLWELWKGFASSTKIDFMRLLNDLNWEQSRLGVLWRIALRPRESDVFGLSNTKHLHRIAQSCTRTSSPALRCWCGHLPPQDTSRPDSVVWPLTHV